MNTRTPRLVERAFRSAAQNQEDILLWRAFGGSPIRRYVDAGGPDPLCRSMSQAFQNVGWRGLLVSPNAAHHHMLTLSRPGDSVALAVAGSEDGITTVYCDSAATAATRDPRVAERYKRAGLQLRPADVPIRRLASLIRAWGESAIDFLVLEVDGHEAEALAGAGLRATRPRAIVLRGRPGVETTSWLTAAGYRPTEFVGLHQFFLAEEDYHEFADCFVLPPHAADVGMAADGTPMRLLSGVVEQALAAGHEAAQQVIVAEREVFRSRAALTQVRQDAAAESHARQAELTRIDQIAQATLAELHSLQQHMNAVYASNSWKVTRPLRLASRLLRAARPGARAELPQAAVPTGVALPAAPMPSLRGPLEEALSRRLAGSLPNVDALP